MAIVYFASSHIKIADVDELLWAPDVEPKVRFPDKTPANKRSQCGDLFSLQTLEADTELKPCPKLLKKVSLVFTHTRVWLPHR